MLLVVGSPLGSPHIFTSQSQVPTSCLNKSVSLAAGAGFWQYARPQNTTVNINRHNRPIRISHLRFWYLLNPKKLRPDPVNSSNESMPSSKFFGLHHCKLFSLSTKSRSKRGNGSEWMAESPSSCCASQGAGPLFSRVRKKPPRLTVGRFVFVAKRGYNQRLVCSSYPYGFTSIRGYFS